MAYEVVRDKEYNNNETGVKTDQNIKFTGYITRKQYPNEMRRVVFYDHESNTTIVFYTNNFDLYEVLRILSLSLFEKMPLR